jgi:hypothetical protein
VELCRAVFRMNIGKTTKKAKSIWQVHVNRFTPVPIPFIAFLATVVRVPWYMLASSLRSPATAFKVHQ